MGNFDTQQIGSTPRRWTGPMVWQGSQVGATDDWFLHLNRRDLADIRAAIQASKASAKPLGDLTRHDFDFNSFGRRLLSLRTEILEGRGFGVIRGLTGNHWSDEDLVRIYWGIGVWMGDPVSQNAAGHLLGHVLDQRSDASAGTRIYQTNRAQPFHSDSCDIVGLLCLRQAKYGGASSIASAAAIHNALLDQDPVLLDRLYGLFQCDRYGEIPAHKQAYYGVRIFNDVDGKLVCCAMDPDIRSAPRLDGVNPLTGEQLQALDAFQETAAALALTMTLERGDIQFANNLTVVHARERFDDYPQLDRRRYLVRLWLSSPLGRRLPEFMAERWGNIAIGSVRGGITVPDATPVAQLYSDA